ncbi:MAG TPA: zinc ribbon domain-containing protein [Gaiellaceae bacterium]|nr:zinc ribbon domain-containing protein [Gaiellaceae bacterium]
MPACTRCGARLEATFRFCPWCASPQRRKLVEFFRAHPHDRGRALRVSRYFGDDPQVRFSVWDDEVAQAAVSLDVDEAKRLARFLDVSSGDAAPSLVGRVRDAARAVLRG